MAQMDALRPAFSAQREQRIAPPPRQVGPDDERDADGRTALTLAVLRNDAGAVKLLLDRGADRQARDRFGQTPQGYALAAGDPAVLGAFGLTPASRPLQSSP